ncbi:hydrolase 1, exosortase A system-associated [Leptolyngbya sp. 15MV]|nr:hydrolase 1, exosortase A system-associated [Leptolyngbya sp. 15MV]
MSRVQLYFNCDGQALAGTFDGASGAAGLLIVSGGNELRSGAFSGQAQLAARVAAAGHPVFRFDRRGVGDSAGANLGFRHSAPDIAAALAAFRAAAPGIGRVVAFGNCDGASALMLAGGAGCDALLLSNPWTIEDAADDTPPPEALRARYLEKLKRPSEIVRLLRGGVNLGKLARGLRRAATPSAAPSSLAGEMRAGIAGYRGEVSFLLATADRTAQAFESQWDRADPRILRRDDASHAWVEPHAREWLIEQVLAALRA